MLFIQRWTGAQLLFPTWLSWHSINRMAILANKFSTSVTTASTHNQLTANFPVCALISINPSTPSTPGTTLKIQTRGLSKTPRLCSKTTFTASINLAIQSNCALLRTSAFIHFGLKAKTFLKVHVKPVNSSLLLWSLAGFLATVAALRPTNEALWHPLYMFEKFVYPICRKK